MSGIHRFLKERRPQEILTIANHILGKNQLSLAKYLFIAAREDNEQLSTNHIADFMQHILERIDFTRDLHFYTETTIDTLDYSGEGLNSGSKLVFAAAGSPKRQLTASNPLKLKRDSHLAIPGVLTIQGQPYVDAETAEQEIDALKEEIEDSNLEGIALLVLCDDAAFTAANVNNLVWVTFTRSNPAADVDGLGSFTRNKHWGCTGPLIIDARRKPHHAPELIKDPEVEKRIDRFKL